MERYQQVINTYGKEHFEKIWNSKVLVVGAGGIGCEILKNLALTGFRQIELIDLDTIDVSNLNRQFLFRPEHVGQSKALVASHAAKTFNPDIQVTAHHANVKDSQFGTSYIQQFNVVLNALDNVDARRHVNRLCLAAKVPLLDSGTTGFLGQVTPIVKGRSACYECFSKPTQKVYPICTIRSTPDKPVHCIVWAKECFKLLFGCAAESMLFEDSAGTGDSSTYMHLLHFPTVERKNVEMESDAKANAGIGGLGMDAVDAVLRFGQQLAEALFGAEIEKRLKMDVYKTAKVAPEPVQAHTVADAVASTREMLLSSSPGAAAGASAPCLPSRCSGWDQRIFSLHENLVEFLACLCELAGRAADFALLGKLSFDKDDLWAMRFVAAAANIRCHIFSIPLLSFHDAKGVAGNIIPAIATTNAIVAGIQVMQAVRLLKTGSAIFDLPAVTPTTTASTTAVSTAASTAAGAEATVEVSASSRRGFGPSGESELLRRVCPHVYCLRLPTRKGLFLQPSSVEPPVPSCYVCGKAELTLQIDVSASTLGDLVSRVVKGRLGCNEPTLMVGANCLYEEGEDADEDLLDNLPLRLENCPAGGITDGAVVVVDDYSQHLQLQLLVRHVPAAVLATMGEGPAADLFAVEGQAAFQQKLQQQQQREADKVAAAAATAAAKEADPELSDSRKKRRKLAGAVAGASAGGIIIIDADDDGAGEGVGYAPSSSSSGTAAAAQKVFVIDDSDDDAPATSNRPASQIASPPDSCLPASGKRKRG